MASRSVIDINIYRAKRNFNTKAFFQIGNLDDVCLVAIYKCKNYIFFDYDYYPWLIREILMNLGKNLLWLIVYR